MSVGNCAATLVSAVEFKTKLGVGVGTGVGVGVRPGVGVGIAAKLAVTVLLAFTVTVVAAEPGLATEPPVHPVKLHPALGEAAIFTTAPQV